LNSITLWGYLDYRLDSEASSTMIGHDIIGFAVVAFLITVTFIVSPVNRICSHFCPGLDYRLDSEASSTMIGHDIIGFAVVAFLITVIFIRNLP
jgi:hypothetical protein